jgi:hypothetical protein
MSRVSESATQMPSGLTIESIVVCSFPRTVRDAGSRHEIRARNRGLNAYTVTIKGTCETPEISYSTPSGNLSTWSGQMRVPSRPGRGGGSLRVIDCGLCSLGASTGATVRVDLVAQVIGFPYAANDSVSVQVDTE